jgi:hypothetical protein
MDTVELVRENCRIAEGFASLSDPDRESLLARVSPHAEGGALEHYKHD